MLNCRSSHAARPAAVLAALFLWYALPATAQLVRPPESGGLIYSIGQPRTLHWSAGLSSGVWMEGPGSALMVRAEGGVSRALASPVVGLIGAGLEGYLGMRETDVDGGVRGMLNVPYFGLGVGAEYNFLDAHLNLIVSATTPLHRGGIVRPGGMLRVNWYPMESHGFTVGISLPIGDPLVGRTRPIRDYVVVARDFAPLVPYEVIDRALDDAIDSIATSAEWIRRTTVPFLDQDGRDTRTAEARAGASLAELRAHLARRGSEAEVRYFHAQLEQVFRIASGSDSVAGRLARIARKTLLGEVILPYNGLLGQKKRSDELVELGTAARGRFSREVVESGLLSGEETERVLYVFQRMTEILEQLRVRAAAEWDDPRLVWLPLQLALLPEQHDSQEELDALLERATEVEFSDGNAVEYLVNLQFHWELLRTIRETVEYHVLWIHDFPAVSSSGQLDSASLDQVVDGYLATLAERLESYDSVRRLPMFFIFLDEHYYQARKSRIWMTILEDPLHASTDVPEATPEQQARITAALQRVRTAAASSKLLRAEARQYGDAWLRNRVKVHVNITNRADPSFWSGGLVSSVFAYPDNLMRDHRKIVFRDVTESDPYCGEAMYTGMGVGKQYLGPTWDDRSVRVRGPALQELRRSARDLLLSQGMPESDLPRPFGIQSDFACADTAGSARTDSVKRTARALQLSNGTGYLPKPLNVGKALLYSLMPKGSVIKIPDSLWNSFLYGGVLVGACLRGVDVTVVSPSKVNAPSAAVPTLARNWELMSRLLMARDSLLGAMEDAGGALWLSLYTLPPDERGFASRAQTWLELLGRTVLLKGLPPLYDMADSAAAEAAARPGSPVNDPPKLHQKVQFLATPAYLSATNGVPETRGFWRAYYRYREATSNSGNSPDSAVAPAADLRRLAERIYGRVRGVPGAAGYAIVGSQNQDYRGMFMDGEVALVFSGPEALIPWLDLMFLEGTATLLTDRAQLDSLLPPPSEYLRRVSRVGKDGM